MLRIFQDSEPAQLTRNLRYKQTLELMYDGHIYFSESFFSNFDHLIFFLLNRNKNLRPNILEG